MTDNQASQGPATTRGGSSGRHLLDLFGAIRIINLPNRTDRQREMLDELGRIGIAGDDRVAFHAASRFEDSADFPTTGARGCFHSHLSVLEEAAASGARAVLILEDDLDFERDFDALMPAVREALDRVGWSVFFGGALNLSSDGPVTPIERLVPETAVMGAHFIAFRGDAIGAAASYLRAMLDRPAGSPLGGPMHVDGAYSWFRRENPAFESWIAKPFLGHQRPSRTDIHELGWKDRIPLVRDLIALGRRLRRRIQ
jgi:hypothetical protein